MSKTVNPASFLYAPTPENIEAYNNAFGSDASSLREFVAEFCLATGTRADHESRNGSINVMYPNGFIAGKLSVSLFWDGDKHDPVYNFSSVMINKAKRDKYTRSLSTRSSMNIKSLLTALKKAGDYPVWSKQEKTLQGEIGSSFSYAMPRDHMVPRIDFVAPEMALCAFQFVLKKIDSVPYDMQKLFQVKYDEYLAKVEIAKSTEKVADRFRKGMRVLGVATESTRARPIYYYTEIHFPKAGAPLVFDIPVQRYEDVAQIEAIHMDMVFAKTVFEKSGNMNDSDPMRIPAGDKYYEDLDMGTGYVSGHRTAHWVFIPKESA